MPKGSIPSGLTPTNQGQRLTYDQIKAIIPHVDEKYIRKLLDSGYGVDFFNSAAVPGGGGGSAWTDQANRTIQLSNDPGISGNLAHEVIHGLQSKKSLNPFANVFNAPAQYSAGGGTGSGISTLAGSALASLMPNSLQQGVFPGSAPVASGDLAGGANLMSELVPYGSSPRGSQTGGSAVQQGLLKTLFPGYFTAPEPTGITAASLGLVGPSGGSSRPLGSRYSSNEATVARSEGRRTTTTAAPKAVKTLAKSKIYRNVGFRGRR